MLFGRRAWRMRRWARSWVSCTLRTSCVSEGLNLEGCNSGCDSLPPGTAVHSCDGCGGPKEHRLQARLWELDLFSLAERKLKGLSTAGGLHLLKGQLQKGWSWTLPESDWHYNKGYWPCFVSWKDQLGDKNDVLSARSSATPIFWGFQAY